MFCARKWNDYIHSFGLWLLRQIQFFFFFLFPLLFRRPRFGVAANTNAHWFILSAVCNRPGWAMDKQPMEEKRKHFKITASIKCQRQCSDGENQRQYRWRRCRRQQRKWKICSPISNIFFNLHYTYMCHFYGNIVHSVALCLPCFCENVQFI